MQKFKYSINYRYKNIFNLLITNSDLDIDRYFHIANNS